MKVTAYKAAKILGVNRSTVSRWIKAGKLKGKREKFRGRVFYTIMESDLKGLRPRCL